MNDINCKKYDLKLKIEELKREKDNLKTKIEELNPIQEGLQLTYLGRVDSEKL